ncbi:LPXTG cell wall anchor domain-containing protein [Microbacterium sp. KSW2-21]|uniref:LPXTG cell wall anchor domain-containing protein n=1 Tax=Microbacterium algihabitans TaxID=3075992 RepID=A0ABU3RVF7_9MICO|nr:LPXTG cell wall anchor domain-containing protein [Microbacterium sp. KSW2-21]MDU0326871.1 LPXTG cell wall anchor domain-containing protein [Microbacterium sp. KSW2-21]
MKLNITKAGASLALAGALLFAAPAVAQAYVPSSPDTVTLTVTSNGPVPVAGFQPGAPVTFTLVGVGVTGANIATANLPVSSASVTKTADASGSATAVVTLPANPVGSYTLAATGARADGSTGGGSGSGTGGGTNAGGSEALPATGMDANSMLGIWVGGGALVLAGAAVMVVTKTRRRNESA